MRKLARRRLAELLPATQSSRATFHAVTSPQFPAQFQPRLGRTRPKRYLVRRAVEMACANSACIAAVMSPSVVTVKNMPVEAQLSRLGLIWFWYGATQLLYQELVVSGRYSVYSTAIWMPRFFTVVHHGVLNGCRAGVLAARR